MVEADKIIQKADEERERIHSLLPDAAEFFHSYEGQMFERSEAIEELSQELEVEEEVANRLIAGLVADEVDPVVQVRVGNEKNVGVIDYEENGFYYSYTDWDDVDEDRKVSVCVQCVKEEEYDQDVFRVEGEDPEEALRDHISREHRVSPREVRTGASLLSGTTIAGNTAFHSGNDGLGSGLNADTLGGTHASAFARLSSPGTTNELQKGYTIVEESQFDASWATAQSLTALATDSNDCIWSADKGDDSIYKLDQSSGLTKVSQFQAPSEEPQGLVFSPGNCIWVASDFGDRIDRMAKKQPPPPFSTPEGIPEGIGVDSNGCLWHADLNNSLIYRLDQSGNVDQSFGSPGTDPGGIGVNTDTGCLWHADSDDNSIYRINPSSGVVDQSFGSPGTGTDGLGVDLNTGCLWNSDFSDDSIYRIDPSTGNVDQSFGSPDSIPRGLGVDSNGCLWNADDNSDVIHRLDQSGNVDQSFVSPGNQPRGLGVDPNTDCLWHVISDSSEESIYRLDQSGVIAPLEFTYAAPGGAPHGLTFDNKGSLWHIDPGTDEVYRLEKGAVQSCFSSPSATPRGLGVDSNDCIWHADFEGDGSIYRLDQFGSVDQSFASPSLNPDGLGVDHSTGCLWHADNDSSNPSIYKMQQSSTTLDPAVQDGFGTPGSAPAGLGVDNSGGSNDGCLWHSDFSDGSIYRLDQSGNVDQSFAAPSKKDPEGLDVDSTGCLWVADNDINSQSIYRLDQRGIVIDSFAAPGNGTGLRGLGVDSDGRLWQAHVNDESIYKVAPLGPTKSPLGPTDNRRGLGFSEGALWSAGIDSIFKLSGEADAISQWSTPSAGGWGIAFTSDGCMWHADEEGSIYKFFPSATVFRNL